MSVTVDVHEQCLGRIDRDGQQHSVMAHYLESQDGSDPIVIDALGVKRQQSEGVRNPGGPLVERADLGEDGFRRAAREFLQLRGVSPEATRLSLRHEDCATSGG